MTHLKNLMHQKPLVGLSPMDGITDAAFRLLQIQIAKPDFMFTEFVSAEGITRGGVKLYDQFLYKESERPIVAQLFGKDPESFYRAAVILCYLGFDGIDINMGCPARTVTQNGSGAALITKPSLAAELIRAVKSGVSDYFNSVTSIKDLKLNQKTMDIIARNLRYSGAFRSKLPPSVSVKTRTGIEESMVVEWVSFLLKERLDFISIHGRTLKQGYSGQADWNEIAKAVKLADGSETKIIGNGDINSYSQGRNYCQKYGTAAALVGRGAMGNPWLFADKIPTPKERFDAALLHAQIFLEIFPNRRFEPLRKNFLSYASGLPHAKNLRRHLVKINSVQELLALEELFLAC